MAKDNKSAKTESKAEKKEAKKAKKANREKDPEMKKLIVKCVAIVACAGILSGTIGSGFSKIADAERAALENTAGEESFDDTSSDDFFADYEDTGAADTGSADAGAADTGAADTGAADTGAADTGAADTGAADTGAADAGTAGKTDAGAAASSVPQTPAEIISYYNTATAKAAKAAVPFQKDRTTTEKSYKAGVALSAFKSIVYKFMGVGDANKFTKTVTAEDKDSYHKYFQASKLTAADVTSATCKQSGDNYLITIKIKDGTSSVKGGKVVNSNNAPIDRSGLACGDDDKDYWDHKPAQNIIAAIDDVPGAASADISEKYSNAVINVVINSKTGNIVSLNAKFDFHMDIANVMGSSGVAEASTTVNMKDFKW